jgi:hypothetical protein
VPFVSPIRSYRIFDKECLLQMSQLKLLVFLDMAPDQLINIYGLSGEFACSFFGTKVIIPLDCLILANGNGRLL